MIRYLNRDEYGKCIPLWKEAFPEDSEAFLDYYFGKKILDSQVIVKEDEGGKMLTMAHLNPYKVRVRDRMYVLPYIVGVATASDSRHQGHMRDVLVTMLQDMHEAHTPFCYLMPASPDIYRPFGFVYVFDQPVWTLREDAAAGVQAIGLRLNEAEDEAGEEEAYVAAAEVQTEASGVVMVEMQAKAPGRMDLSDWMNRWLGGRFQVYAERDSAYLQMLQAELDSEDGQVYGYLDGQGRLAALKAVWGKEKQEQRFLYCDRDEWIQAPEDLPAARPAIMARITDVAAMAEVISVNEDCPCPRMEVMVRIRDRLVDGNHGLWRWRLGTDGSRLERIEGIGTVEGFGIAEGGSDALVSTEVLELTVEQMTAWLLGYRPLDEIMEADSGEIPYWWRYVQPLKGVFLDEVV
ncbi:GNAT family N-acetyltransferase [Clostridiales bacterium TF09-2AC]|nr:GNAT family N-acetyltransferase [Clostridiales bacterium TF09-2AC]